MEVKSLCCTPETDRGLYVKPMSIKLKKEKKKKKRKVCLLGASGKGPLSERTSQPRADSPCP